MARLSIIAASVLTVIALPPFLGAAISSPASAQEREWSDSGSAIGDGDLRDLLQDWVQGRADRRDMLMDLLQERRDRHSDLRGQLRERITSRLDEEDDNGGYDRGGWRSRLRERLAERRGGNGNCYFFTRSLRNEDGSLLVIVRRRVCRD
ncbi:MAG: hypothetical protein ABW003_02760 [Microvirga sp.]